MCFKAKSTLIAIFCFFTVLNPHADAVERILRINDAPIGELDPAKGKDVADTILAINIYDTLVYPKQAGSGVQPLLASDWTIDDTIYTFSLRKDVNFESGNPLTADDVVFSYERMMAIDSGHSSLFDGRVDSVYSVDNHTVAFALTEAYAPFLASLVRLPIVDSKTVKAKYEKGPYGDHGDYGTLWLSRNSAGTGAYIAESHNPQEKTVLIANSDHFRSFEANHPEKVHYLYGLDNLSVRALMAVGEHEVSSPWLAPEIYSKLASKGTANLIADSGMTVEYFPFNTHRAPLDDVHCRRALAHAFDYETLLRLVRINDETSKGTAMNGPIPSGHVGWDETAHTLKQDMALARKELALCKYKQGERPLEIAWISETPARERGALMMQSLYSELGFDVTINRIPWMDYIKLLNEPDNAPHIVEIAVNAVTTDTDSLLHEMHTYTAKPSFRPYIYFNNKNIDDLLKAGQREIVSTKREKIYRKLSSTMIEFAPGIFGYQLQSILAVRKGVEIPNLTNPNRTYKLTGYSMLFKDMNVRF